MKVTLTVPRTRRTTDDELAVLAQQRGAELAATLRAMATALEAQDPEFRLVFPLRDAEGNEVGEAVMEGL